MEVLRKGIEFRRRNPNLTESKGAAILDRSLESGLMGSVGTQAVRNAVQRKFIHMKDLTKEYIDDRRNSPGN